MLALVDKSKQIPTKPDVSEENKNFNAPKMYNLHCQLIEKSMTNAMQLQAEINSDEASIFQNKKYKELIKLASA